MIAGSRLRHRVLSGFAAPLLAIAAPADLPASEGAQPAIVLAQDQAPAQPVPAQPDNGGAAPAQTAPKPAAPPAPKNLEPLPPNTTTGLLGKRVIGPDGKELGLVVDVVVDADGHPRAAVIDFGGFLGVGSRKIAIDWRLLSFARGKPDWQVALSLSRAEIQAAPEYKPDAASNQMVGPPWEAPASSDVKK
jgi:hypothetical protein